MTTLILRRLFQMVFILIGVSLFAFLLSYATGDPTTLLMSPNATQAEIEAFRRQMGLDQPVWVQYGRFVLSILGGEFPRSLTYKQDPFALLVERLPATLLLVSSGMALAILVSFPLGIFLAWRRTSWYSSAVMSLTIIGYSTPIYWEAIILALIFSITLGWLPPSGYGSFKHLILPAVAIATQQAALLVRMIWGSAIEVLNTQYILYARAKGLREFPLIVKHVMPNCLIPVITILGLQVAGLMGNAIMTEVIFAWPGIARLTVEAVFYRDYPLVQACVIFMAFIFVIANLMVDITYGMIDPRVRTT